MKTPNVSSFRGAYILGLLWGCGTMCGDSFLVRHKDISVLKDIKSGFSLSNKIFYVRQQHALKITRQAGMQELLAWLDSLGWARRQAQNRPYPEGNINDEGFICGWCKLHASCDTVKARSGISPRVRIYGNVALLQTMNERVAESVELPIMKLQKTPNEITKVLYYQGSSAEALKEWLGIDEGAGTNKRAPDGYLTIAEAARKYGFEPVALYARLRAGKIKDALHLSFFWYVPDVEPTEENGLAQIESGYVTLAEAARRLNLTREQIGWLQKKGRIPNIKQVTGFFWVVPVEWVETYKKEIQLPEGEYVTFNEAAEMLGVDRYVVVYSRDNGKIDGAICIRGHWHIPLEWVKKERVRRETKRILKALYPRDN